MLEDSITDFRHVIEEKLKLKENALDQTEQHLKKFSILRENNGFNSNGPPISRNNDRNMGKQQQQRGSIRGRLGPPANSRPSMESRLGPKVQENEPAADQDPFQEETRSVLSRVVVEQQKSRDEALAEEDQKMDKKEKQVSFSILFASYYTGPSIKYVGFNWKRGRGQNFIEICRQIESKRVPT